MKYPYFRFTRASEKYDGVLESWFDHFEKKNIPCAITKHEGNYLLYRTGQEAYVDWGLANCEEIQGEIIRECHGFSSQI